MDERSWRLACAALAVSLVAMAVDAASDSFTINNGFWTFLVALMGFLGARALVKTRNNNGPGQVKNG
jgi:Na+-transporting NADH:ubiquinone oxidoreductase subunit NqrB